ELLVPEGETRPVGSPIALIDTASGEPAAEAPVPRQAPAGGPAGSDGSPAPARATAGRAAAGGVRLSPLVRKLAEEHRIPPEVLEGMAGSGAGGRVTKDDVLRYVAGRGAAPTAPEPGGPAAPPGGPASTPPVAPPATADEVVRLSPLRRAIAQRMAQSKREIPHAYGVIEVDMSAVVAWREAQRDAWRAREGVPLTYTAFFVRAACAALRAHPVVNASWSDDGLILRRAVHVGVGIAVDDGLLVPVIHDADRLSLAGVARALDDLTRRARAGRLTLDDIGGGTFTITNPGVFGSIWSMPIIVPGQAAILATDAIVKRAVVRDDAIAIRPVMHLGLAFDHRIFDGAVAMQFLNHMKGWFEDYRDGR
ncbi:MAG: dihydrolipoamide acetyltransferase family protein, partial [Armatimonadota bacterium]|nr:dihydrolipoamide acetyltransferase family protein [Armatimonadota bacterium]